jgi:hypothetical protein
MDQRTEIVRAFLVSIQSVREALADLVRQLYKRREVRLVSTYNPEVCLSQDFGVSAALHNGAVVDFWITLSNQDTSWLMEYSVRRHDPDEDGCHTEKAFSSQTIESVGDMQRMLLAAIEEMRQASVNEALYR